MHWLLVFDCLIRVEDPTLYNVCKLLLSSYFALRSSVSGKTEYWTCVQSNSSHNFDCISSSFLDREAKFGITCSLASVSSGRGVPRHRPLSISPQFARQFALLFQHR